MKSVTLCLLLFDRTKNLKKEIDLFNDSMIIEMHVSRLVCLTESVGGKGEMCLCDERKRRGKASSREERSPRKSVKETAVTSIKIFVA